MINKRLIGFLAGTKKYIGLTVIFQWIALMANVIMIFSIAFLLKGILEGKISAVPVVATAMTVLAVVIVRIICHMLSVKFSAHASFYVKKVLRDKIYEKLLKIGADYQEKIATSEAVQAAVEGVEQLEVYFGKYLPQFFYSMLAPFTLFVVLSFVNGKIALVLLACVPLIPVTIIVIQKIAKKISGKYWGSYTDLGERFLENLQGLTTLKIYGADGRKAKEMDREAEKFRRATMQLLYMQLNSIAVMDIIAFGGAAAGIILSILEYERGTLSFTGAFVIIMLSAEFFLPLRLLGSLFHVAMNGMAASEKIFFILDLEEQKQGREYSLKEIHKIQCTHLNFSYDGKREILKDINMEMNKKQLISIVGASGCGKSTIASLLTGKIKGYGGSIQIGGMELSLLSGEELLGLITLVSHNSYLFRGTVEENLRMGKPDAEKEEMDEVLKKAGLYEFIYGREGLQSQVMEKSSNFSGGQSQRLALARALLRDSPVYIFDEVTSNIDAQSEKQIMEVIYELAKEKIVILISHRLRNVINSRCIYMIEQGKIVQGGTHVDIVKEEGAYKALYENQINLELYTKKTEEGRRPPENKNRPFESKDQSPENKGGQKKGGISCA